MASEESIERLNISKKFLEPLGLLTIWFSVLESEIDHAIYNLIDIDSYTGSAITGQFTSFRVKLEMLLTLVGLWIQESPQRKHLLAVLDSVEKINGKRNDLVHGRWVGRKPFGAIKISKMARRKLTFPWKRVTVEGVMETAWHAEMLSYVIPSALSDCPKRKPNMRAWLEILAERDPGHREQVHHARKVRRSRHPPSRE
ncbi:MAG: hypothetical protein HY017_18600 [Betaproteobacteria bacterium]|nr:hypothetical protein [Betaproteobacteria bacterium]